MPKQVRNFWIELEVDGRKTKIFAGPRNKNGGFNLCVKIREKGTISDKEFKLSGKVLARGKEEYLQLTGTLDEQFIDLVTEK